MIWINEKISIAPDVSLANCAALGARMGEMDIVIARQAVEEARSTAPSFARAVLVLCVVGIAALAVWKLSDVLVGFVVARPRSRARPPDAEAWAVLPVVIFLFGSVVAVGWLFGSQIASQFNVLAKDLPQSLTQLAHEFGSSSLGAWLLGHAQDIKLGTTTLPIAGYVAALFGFVFRTVAYIAVLRLAAIYLALQPARYVADCWPWCP